MSAGTDTVPIDQDRFRAIMGCFPAGVAVIAATDAGGRPRGFTSTAVSSVSVRPPLLLVCVDRTSNTLPALRHSGAFVVNFLAAGREAISQLFASKHEDKFRGLAWRPSDIAEGAPILVGDCAAHAECRIVQEVEAGDHVVLIGRVEAGDVVPDEPPMVFRQGVYRRWPLDAVARRTG
jgi:flavin reductase (DIM6/NTAB) family NADH-FMN oxidoreductase RutF